MLDYKKLNEHLDEEYQGVIEYVDLYEQTKEGIFRDMAREEMTHARHLEWYISKAGELTDHTKTKEAAEKALNGV
jgi:rubrerythrin